MTLQLLVQLEGEESTVDGGTAVDLQVARKRAREIIDNGLTYSAENGDLVVIPARRVKAIYIRATTTSGG